MIRQAGDSQTTEIVYSTERAINPEPVNDLPVWARSLVSALGEDPSGFLADEHKPPYEVCDYKLRQNFGRRRKAVDSEGRGGISGERELRDSIPERAPNLIMNVPNAIPTRSSVWAGSS